MDDVVLSNYGHLAPALFVVGRARVGHREVGVRSDDAADLVQRLDPRLAREHLVLGCVPAHTFVTAQTARPHASSASRPACVMRAAVHGGSQTTLIRTSFTPSSRSRRSRKSSRMNSEAGQPMAGKGRATSTPPPPSPMP